MSELLWIVLERGDRTHHASYKRQLGKFGIKEFSHSSITQVPGKSLNKADLLFSYGIKDLFYRTLCRRTSPEVCIVR
jgi:hypothetical protein